MNIQQIFLSFVVVLASALSAESAVLHSAPLDVNSGDIMTCDAVSVAKKEQTVTVDILQGGTTVFSTDTCDLFPGGFCHVTSQNTFVGAALFGCRVTVGLAKGSVRALFQDRNTGAVAAVQ
jgi:hypothetical protein